MTAYWRRGFWGKYLDIKLGDKFSHCYTNYWTRKRYWISFAPTSALVITPITCYLYLSCNGSVTATMKFSLWWTYVSSLSGTQAWIKPNRRNITGPSRICYSDLSNSEIFCDPSKRFDIVIVRSGAVSSTCHRTKRLNNPAWLDEIYVQHREGVISAKRRERRKLFCRRLCAVVHAESTLSSNDWRVKNQNPHKWSRIYPSNRCTPNNDTTSLAMK